MRYAIIDGEIKEVVECDTLYPSREGCCPYCDISCDISVDYSDGWLDPLVTCALTDRPTGHHVEIPDWCPLPSDKPGTGAEYLDMEN